MEKDYLILKRASASRPSGERNEDDFDVIGDGFVVGRIFKVNAAPVGQPWMWTLAFGVRPEKKKAQWVRFPMHLSGHRAKPSNRRQWP
jgi:hypothetical protein